MKRFFDRRAFTLAELMAVVVIIAILAGIAIGSYNKSVRRAQFADMKSVAHQVAAARDAYYYDEVSFGKQGSFPIDFSYLTLDLEKCSRGTVCRINNYTVSIGANDYVLVKHADGFGLRVYQEADISRPEDKCCGDSDFCSSVGYSASNITTHCI